jgi:hypothetical protein
MAFQELLDSFEKVKKISNVAKESVEGRSY